MSLILDIISKNTPYTSLPTFTEHLGVAVTICSYIRKVVISYISSDEWQVSEPSALQGNAGKIP